MVDRYDKDVKTRNPEDQYIWHVRMDGNIKVVVTAHPTLIALVHGARYLVCDYTFKRTSGELNEWEVVIWHGATNECELRIFVAWFSISYKCGRCDGGTCLFQQCYCGGI